jgi:hypothetical protein
MKFGGAQVIDYWSMPNRCSKSFAYQLVALDALMGRLAEEVLSIASTRCI